MSQQKRQVPYGSQTFLLLKRRNFAHLKYPLLVFFIVFAVRMIPEVLMGTYPLGFDTIAYYIPITTQWLTEGVDFYTAMATAPLFYMLLSGVTAAGVPFIVSLKILPSILHGVLALTIYYYANKALNWSPKKSLIVALLATLYFVALRVSWDMLRNQLGLIFLFLTLTISSLVLSKSHTKWRHYILFSSVAVLTVLSHQLTAILLFLIFAAEFVHAILKGEIFNFKHLTFALLPALVLFLAFNVLSIGNIAGKIVNNSSVLYFQSSLSNLGFFFFCYLPLLPLVLLGFKYFRDLKTASWVMWCFFILLVPLVFPSLLGLGGHRWTLLLVYPLAFFAVETLYKLKPRIKHISKYLIYCALVILVIVQMSSLSAGFMVKSPDGPLPYFDPQMYNQYPFYVQSSMLQNTIPQEHISDFEKTITWINANCGNDSMVVLSSQIYGLSLMTVQNSVKLVNADELTPFNPFAEQSLYEKCLDALQGGSSRVYTVWWAPTYSWYGISFPLTGFVEEQNFGTFSVYAFSST